MGKIVMARKVRCSFPQLWHEEEKGGQTYGRSVTLIVEPSEHSGLITEVKQGIKAVAAAEPKFKGKLPAPHLLCLREGDREEYGPKAQIIKCNTPRTPIILGLNGKKVTEDEDKIYSGCYVSAKFEIWPQANQNGKRVNAKLLAIQFAGDGESFDGSYVPEEVAVEGFGSLEDDDLMGGDDPMGDDDLM